MAQFHPADDGRLFYGERNGKELPKPTIVRAWQRARAEVFTPEVAASPLAGSPYDLRHAAVSTWLNGGVPSTTVAAWAGHSVEILHKIYAKCLDGEDAAVRQRVQTALGHGSAGQNLGTHLAQTPGDDRKEPGTAG
jgi:integrase